MRPAEDLTESLATIRWIRRLHGRCDGTMGWVPLHREDPPPGRPLGDKG